MSKIKLCGLWKQKTKEGNTYYSGQVGKETKLLIFPNTRKTAEGQPDFEVFIGESEGFKSTALLDSLPEM